MQQEQTQKQIFSSSSKHQGCGSVISWEQIEEGIKGSFQRGFFRITFSKEAIARIQISQSESFEENPYSVIKSDPFYAFDLEEEEKYLHLQTETIRSS